MLVGGKLLFPRDLVELFMFEYRGSCSCFFVCVSGSRNMPTNWNHELTRNHTKYRTFNRTSTRTTGTRSKIENAQPPISLAARFFLIRRRYSAAVVGDDLPFAAAFHPDMRAAELYVSDTFDRSAMGHDRRVAIKSNFVIVGLDHIGIRHDRGEVLGLVFDLASLCCTYVIVRDQRARRLFIAFQFGKRPRLVQLDQLILDAAFFILPEGDRGYSQYQNNGGANRPNKSRFPRAAPAAGSAQFPIR